MALKQQSPTTNSSSITFITFSIFVFVLSAEAAYAQYYLDYMDSDTSDSYYVGYENQTRFPNWYDVSDEEVEFCQSYGGSVTGNDVYTTAEGGYAQAVSKLTVSLQGYSTILAETTLYEIAWYVHPLDEDIVYYIYLANDYGDSEDFFTGYATALDGDASYDTLETATVYTTLKIVLEDGTTALTVPIVEKV